MIKASEQSERRRSQAPVGREAGNESKANEQSERRRSQAPVGREAGNESETSPAAGLLAEDGRGRSDEEFRMFLLVNEFKL
ncbi:hypothetical protein [uncultured Cohaesibacter sp.]|uniref:hypothetical protein n=1 Tax=uncultured Cohaesibacter sp. TaxID=1002546 RepID=UPI0029C883F0|nr:hypothetical protein [uncultured Cohaesibacter sp.]